MPRSPIERIVVQRLAHQLATQRLVDRVYNQPVIGNVERGAYVECLIELALSDLRPPWSLTGTWDAWDLEQAESGARIEVKQSAALQTWTPNDAPSGGAPPTFDIAPRSGYYGADGWPASEPPQRLADLYVMAWHAETDSSIADHRLPDQWRFYVVPEHRLPPGQKRIGLGPLSRLAEACGFDELAAEVERAMAELPALKAELNGRAED